jgi:hypothetical protein
MSINSVAGIVSAIGRGLACLQQQLPRSTTLRQRLLVAFTCSAAAATLSGFVGVYYVHRISANVTHVSDVTSPLLTETMSLIDAAQRARSAVLLAVEKDPMHAPEQLAALHSEMHARIEGIKTLASRANIDLQSNSIERRERRFAEAAKSIIDASQRRREAAALVNKSLARLTELTQALRSSSASLAALAEGEMTRGEEDAKTSVQTGEATIVALGNSFSRVMTEIYPVVHWKGPISRGARLANLASRVKPFLRPLTKAELSTSKAVAPERSHGGGVGSSSTSSTERDAHRHRQCVRYQRRISSPFQCRTPGKRSI